MDEETIHFIWYGLAFLAAPFALCLLIYVCIVLPISAWGNLRANKERAEYERQEWERFYGKDYATLLRPTAHSKSPAMTLLHPVECRPYEAPSSLLRPHEEEPLHAPMEETRKGSA